MDSRAGGGHFAGPVACCLRARIRLRTTIRSRAKVRDLLEPQAAHACAHKRRGHGRRHGRPSCDSQGEFLNASHDSHAEVFHHFTVDVEEYFQVSALEPFVPRDAWEHLSSRVVDSTLRIVDLLEEAGTLGTFFTLGWVARRHPELVRRIAEAGHEVASHGWDHRRVTHLEPSEFREQVRDSRSILEDLSGERVLGYRAPSFSIVPGREWALEILAEEGYTYDSSLYPVRRRGYGYPAADRHPHLIQTPAGPLHELPPLTVRHWGATLPAGGGGTFRQLPLAYTLRALHALEREGRGGTFYIHPWEVDPEQPRVKGTSLLTRVRHYRGLSRTEARLKRLVATFRFRSIRETLAADA